ncbi:MAG: hypothetical protein WHS63_02290 [Tenuifilum sp.]|uniref:hypothetical protein n=1 Tax=Tenuifilum sp. TaxID=2760880 RepID=UPI0030AE6447
MALTFLLGILASCQKEEIRFNQINDETSNVKYCKFFEVQKGDTIPKNVYRTKPTFTETETVVITSEMQKEVKSTVALTPYVTDLYIIAGNSSAITPPASYIKIDVDLNKGSGGKYIYLCYTKQDIAGPIQGLEVYYGVDKYPYPSLSYPWRDGVISNSAGFGYPGIDLNWGAGGDYIYLYQTRVSGILNPYEGYKPWSKIKEIGVYFARTSALSQVPAGWKRIPVDLNKGAGGSYIYLIYKTE